MSEYLINENENHNKNLKILNNKNINNEFMKIVKMIILFCKPIYFVLHCDLSYFAFIIILHCNFACM